MTSRPKLLPLKQYHAANTSDIALLLEGLKSNQSPENNFAKISEFDNVLSILETSFNANNQPTWLSKISPHENLKVPLAHVLRVVYSLASRPQDSNWSDAATLVMGLKTLDDYTKEQNADYNKDPSKTPLNDRAIHILQQYVDILQPTSTSSDSNLDILYTRLCAVMSDFCVSMYVLKHRYTTDRKPGSVPRLEPAPVLKAMPPKASKLRASKRKAPIDASPTNQSMITSFFEPSPVKKKVKPDIETILVHDSTDEDEQDPDFVSDSDRQESTPITQLETDMELEIEKFQQRGPVDSFSLVNSRGNQAQASNQMSESEIFFRNMTSSDTRSVSPTADDTKLKLSTDSSFKSADYPFKVFDEIPLSYAMNPLINHRFTFWRLINFAFYCADRSSLSESADYNSPYHALFASYKGIIDVTIDLVALNLVRELISSMLTHELVGTAKDCLAILTHQEIAVMKDSLASNNILFQALLSQLSPFSHDWYDRIVEFTFNGLGSSTNNAPKVCYTRDSDLISGYSASKGATTRISTAASADNKDSMSSRHKICLLVYYYSLFHDTLPDDVRSSSSLLSHISNRLKSVDHSLVHALLNCDSSPACIRHHGIYFSIRLAGELLLQSLPDANKPVFKFAGALSSKEATDAKQAIDRSNLIAILSMITTFEAYPDPDAIDNFVACKETWQKLNMLMEWLFATILKLNCEYHLTNELVLNTIHEGCQRADRLRKSIIEHYSLNVYLIQKFETSGPELAATCSLGLISFRDICFAITGTDSTIFTVNWEQEFSPELTLNCI